MQNSSKILSRISSETDLPIIKPRLNEIFTFVGLEIKRSGFGGMTPSGVVLTGGGAQTVGAVESARRNLAMPVHIGNPVKVSGLIDEIMSFEQALEEANTLRSEQIPLRNRSVQKDVESNSSGIHHYTHSLHVFRQRQGV